MERTDVKFHFIVQKDHLEKYDLTNVLKNACAPFEFSVTYIDEITEGAACTVLLAMPHFNNDDELMIANSDQIIAEIEMLGWYETIADDEMFDGYIMVFEASHPKWSYARINGGGVVQEVAEKRVISNLATTGVYWFRRGSDFVDAASEMIRKDIRTNNEFYVCPVYNEMILSDKKISVFGIVPDHMHGVGTPEDLNRYLTHLSHE